MVSALVLGGAVTFTLVAAYQWASRLGAFGVATRESEVRDWQGRAWSTAFAIILWLVWFYG
jgi:hypothetical protein